MMIYCRKFLDFLFFNFCSVVNSSLFQPKQILWTLVPILTALMCQLNFHTETSKMLLFPPGFQFLN